MGHRVLVGIPSEGGYNTETMMQDLIQKAVPDVDEVIFVRDIGSFTERFGSGACDLIFCIDNIGIGVEYAEVVRRADGFSKVLCVMLVPDECYGKATMRRFVDAGCTRVIMMKDLRVDPVGEMRNVIYNGRGSRNDTLEYLGLFLRPVRNEGYAREPKKDTGGGTRVERKYLGGGVAVTRLCAADAKGLGAGGIGEDELLRDIISGTIDIELRDEVMQYKEFPVDEEWVSKYKEMIRLYFRQQGLMFFQSYEHGDMRREDFEAIIVKELIRYKLSDQQARVVCDSFMKDVLSYGKLDAVIRTPDVTDVRLMDKDTVNVQYRGVWYRTNITFETEEAYAYFINRICTINKAAINLHEPETIFTDIKTYKDLTLRITVTHGMLNTNEHYGSHFRIATRHKKDVNTLLKEKFMNIAQASILINAIRSKKSIIICGGSGSGKTILLNMLIEYLNPSVCGTCIQESDELHSETHPNIEFLHSITAKGEGRNGYSLKKLATTSLLKNAELFIIGEIKGDEAADFFTASRTSKVYSTTHADDCFGALPRIVELAKATVDYSQEDILKILAKNIGYCCYCEGYKLKQIAKVVGYDDVRHDVIYDLYDFDAKA